MPDFHETKQGRVYFEVTLPNLIRAIERLAVAVEALNAGGSEPRAEDAPGPEPKTPEPKENDR